MRFRGWVCRGVGFGVRVRRAAYQLREPGTPSQMAVTVPVPVEVKWAGSTPVITVDKVAVPGVGTYSARVVIHDNHYAATWDGGDHGGYMWGKIVKDAKGESKAKEGAKK